MQAKNDFQMERPGRNASRSNGGGQDKKGNFTDPYYTDKRADEGSDLGAIMVHHGVIAVIARIAALKVPGVVEVSGSFADGIANIANMISRNSGERGVNVKMQGQKVDVEINVVVEYGKKIPEVAWQVQNEVRRAIEEMTGKQVGAINVVIQGVRLPLETKPATG
jgi:uncharacterized alkaline shock family protein YloU